MRRPFGQFNSVMDRLFPDAGAFSSSPATSVTSPSMPPCHSSETGCGELVHFFPLWCIVSFERMECPITLPASISPLLCEIAFFFFFYHG